MSSLPNIKQTSSRQNPVDLSYQQTAVRDAIQRHAPEVQADIRFYLLKFGNERERRNLQERVEEIWHETVVEALHSAKHFDTSKPARPWLRVIAIRRVQKSWSDNKRRVELVAPEETAAFKSQTQETGGTSETAMLDRLAAARSVSNFLRKAEDIDEILSVLPDEADRRILKLKYGEDLHGAKLAQAAGAPSEGAAQKAVARALKKLREIYQHS